MMSRIQPPKVHKTVKQKNKNKIAPFIRNFCKEISDETPVLVPLHPLPGKPFDECFNIVPEHMRENGGKQRNGWCIHIWKSVLIEAEFHCVWEDPSEKLIDLTPKRIQGSHIVFLPAPGKKYEGRQVKNIRKALAIDPDVTRIISLFDERFRWMNHGDLADKHGEIPVDEQFLSLTKDITETMFRLTKKFGERRYWTC